MPIVVNCGCGKKVRVADAMAGRQMKCPACNSPLSVPLPGIRAVVDISEEESISSAPPPETKNNRTILAAIRSRVMILVRVFANACSVLVVLLAAWLVYCLFAALLEGDPYRTKLKSGELRKVEDFATDDIFTPTTFMVCDRDYQRNPTIGLDGHMFFASLDRDTLVMVDHDTTEPSVRKRGTSAREIDERMVWVVVISGPLSGRIGMIARYKLSPLEH